MRGCHGCQRPPGGDDVFDVHCALHDVYYHRGLQRVFYFARSAHESAAPPVVDLLRFTEERPHGWGLHAFWRPTVVVGAAPPALTHCRRVLKRPAALLVSWNAGNFGHVMIDEYVRAVRLLWRFGLDVDDAVAPVVFFANAPCSPSRSEKACRMHELIWPAYVNEGTLRDLPLAIDNGTLDAGTVASALQDSADDTAEGMWLRIESLVVGSGSLGLPRQDHEYHRLRERTLWKLGGESLWRLYATVPTPHAGRRVLVIRKNGRRSLGNTEEIEAALAAELPALGHSVDVTTYDELARLTFAQQVGAVLPYDVVLTPGGGATCMLMLMRPGSAAVITTFWDALLNRTGELEDGMWTRDAHRLTLLVPLAREDVRISGEDESYLRAHGHTTPLGRYRIYRDKCTVLPPVERVVALVREAIAYVDQYAASPPRLLRAGAVPAHVRVNGDARAYLLNATLPREQLAWWSDDVGE